MMTLVVKPTLDCNANCRGCRDRRRLHRHLRQTQSTLTLTDWSTVFRDAVALGAREVVISGGEPTLYPDLIPLVRMAREHRFQVVKLNTNGSELSEELLQELARSGVDWISVSLHSHRASVHDAYRGRPGSWREATTALRVLIDITAQYPDLLVTSQAILLRENIAELHELLQLHLSLRTHVLSFSLLEADFENRMRPTPDEIARARAVVIPALAHVADEWGEQGVVRSVNRIASLYPRTRADMARWSAGQYRSERRCDRPFVQGLILANGDVHPCNIVEYTHSPVIGNLRERRLYDLWHGRAWRAFRSSLHSSCSRCPIGLDEAVALRTIPPGAKAWFIERARAIRDCVSRDDAIEQCDRAPCR